MSDHTEQMIRRAALRHSLDTPGLHSRRTLLALARHEHAVTHGKPGELAAAVLADTEYGCGLLNATMSDLDAIALSATRYSLGRTSAMPHICADWLISVWSRLDAAVKDPILRDIENALSTGRAGEACDEEAWKTVLRCAASPAGATQAQPALPSHQG